MRCSSNNVHSFQRPDADHVELDPFATSMRGHSGNINFDKIAGERTRLNVNIGYRSPGFEVNDLGFQRRADEIPQNSWLQVRWDKPGKYTRNIRHQLQPVVGVQLRRRSAQLGRQHQLALRSSPTCGTRVAASITTRSNFDDRLTRGGPGGYTLPNVNGWYYLNTDDRKKVSFNWNFNFYRTSRSHGFAVEPRVVIRPTAAFSAEFGHLFDHGISDAQWVTEEIMRRSHALRVRRVSTSRPAR